MNYNILTIFPGLIDTFSKTGYIKKSLNKGIINLNLVNIRDYSDDIHHRVDDKVYGGGPGMILKYPPIEKAIRDIKDKGHILYLSPQGKILNQNNGTQFLRSKNKHIIKLGNKQKKNYTHESKTYSKLRQIQ